MNRRSFNRGAMLAGLASLFAPLVSFGKRSEKKIKEVIKYSFGDGPLLGRCVDEPLFARYVKSKEGHVILGAQSANNTVLELVANKTGKQYSMREYWEESLRPRKWWEKDHNPNDYIFKCGLSQYMQIEFEYENDYQFAENKHKAFVMLAQLFDKCAVNGDISNTTLFKKCFSMRMTSLEHGVNRDMLAIYPFSFDINKYGATYSFHKILNEKLGVPIFCAEGVTAKVLIRKNGKVEIREDDNVVILPDKFLELQKKYAMTHA